MATVSQTPLGWYGFTDGPPISVASKPLAASAYDQAMQQLDAMDEQELQRLLDGSQIKPDE